MPTQEEIAKKQGEVDAASPSVAGLGLSPSDAQANIRAGYVRTPGYDPSKSDRTQYQAEAHRPPVDNTPPPSYPAYPTRRLTGEAKDDEVKKRATSGTVIDNSVF
jgi:hypothetical protein